LGPGRIPWVKKSIIDPQRRPDVTFVNLNLMLVNNCDGTFDQQAYLPLGLLYIAAYLAQAGYNSEFVDYQLFSHNREFDVEKFVDALGSPAKVVGISCMSNLLPLSIQCARALKVRHPDVKVVLGGVGPSPVARQICDAFPFIDHVVEGEGELIMLDILRGQADRLPRPRISRDLDTLPLPAYELIDFKLYDAAPSIITSRGCPFKCTFCTEPYNFSGTLRFRNVDSVLEELELVHARSGRKLFLFQDDILPLKRERFLRLLEGFRKLSFPIEWKCFSRVDLMDEELMAAMVASGCKQIRYGVESGSNKTLDRIKKEFTIERAFDAAAKSVRYFSSVHASFIWGYPFEELPEFEETLEWVERFEEVGVSVLLFEYSPLPGSPLYQEYRGHLTFSRDRYSFYVITGHEMGQAETDGHSEPIYSLIRDHPQIFSGFYQYDNFSRLKARQRLEHFNITRRTPVRNEHDL
jgi:radical SAM superfamily enzyme YgiQ (UPF0313 family)